MNKMDCTLTSMWVSFFTTAGIPSDVAATYALTFAENRIQSDMLLDLNKEYLRDMDITRMGDVIAILRHAKQVHESTARDRVLGSTVSNVVPVAAVTGRATITQNKPSSPASRILEHYIRNPPVQETFPTPPVQQKRKICDIGIETGENKKTRLIRFSSPQPPKEVSQSKNTVFARLGQTDATTVAVPAPPKDVKPIYARLGSKSENQVKPVSQIPVQKDALKYEGILKSPPVVKKVVTITTSKNSVRKIAMGCTMRADEQPVSVRQKLTLPKSKSVQFSNHIEYKEIEAVNRKNEVVRDKIVVAKQTVFNKPERRLSMPEVATNSVKARLGAKNANNLTITKNVFNRLGGVK